jgi:hypothetical protein
MTSHLFLKLIVELIFSKELTKLKQLASFDWF